MVLHIGVITMYYIFIAEKKIYHCNFSELVVQCRKMNIMVDACRKSFATEGVTLSGFRCGGGL